MIHSLHGSSYFQVYQLDHRFTYPSQAKTFFYNSTLNLYLNVYKHFMNANGCVLKIMLPEKHAMHCDKLQFVNETF